MKAKIAIAIAAFLLTAGVAVLVGNFASDHSLTTAQAGSKITAYYNANATKSQIVKTLRCIQGKKDKSVYLCAAVADDSAGNTVCLTLIGQVTDTSAKIESVAVDQMACYFAS